MISYGSGGCGGCVRYIQRAEQPLFEGAAGKDMPPQPMRKAHRQHRVPVLCVEKCELFPSLRKAAEWLVDNGHVSSYETARRGVARALSGERNTAFGMRWRRMDGGK